MHPPRNVERGKRGWLRRLAVSVGSFPGGTTVPLPQFQPLIRGIALAILVKGFADAVRPDDLDLVHVLDFPNRNARGVVAAQETLGRVQRAELLRPPARNVTMAPRASRPQSGVERTDCSQWPRRGTTLRKGGPGRRRSSPASRVLRRCRGRRTPGRGPCCVDRRAARSAGR